MREARSKASGCCNRKSVIQLFCVTLGVLLFSAATFGQTANGRILGTVKDQTGALIPGVAVTVTDTARGIARNLITGEVGAYLAPNLLPSTYTVHATFPGFQAWQRENIRLEVGQDLTIDVVLLPGAQTETVSITEEIPLVNATSSVLGGTLSNQTINDLPLNGRNFTLLLEMRPGVVLTLGNDSGGAGAAATNGLRPENSNEYLVEGLHGMSPFNGQPVMNSLALRGDAATVLPVDAIQEFNQQFNGKAEYGWRAGGTTNIGLKSGTNAIHGTAYSFFRRDAWDARNYFNKDTLPKVNTNLNQFGGTLGGPIKKDKLFVFLGYEQQRLNVGDSSAATVAFTDPAMIANFPACINAAEGCSPIPNSVAGARTPDASNHLILACLGLAAASRSPQSLLLAGLNPNCTPNPNYPTATTGAQWFVPHGGNDHGATSNPAFGINAYFANSQSEVRTQGGVGKVDYQLNNKNTVSGFFFRGLGDDIYSATNATNPDWRTRVGAWSWMGAGTWSWFPNPVWANSFRVGYASLRHRYVGVDTSTGVTSASLGLPTGVNKFLDRSGGYPQSLTLNGFSAFGSRNTEIEGPNTSIEINDQVSYLLGNHSVRFGGVIMTNHQNGGTWANTKGNFGFGQGANSEGAGNGLLAFLAGQNAILDNIPGALGYCPTPGVVVGSNCVGAVAIRTTTTGLESASLFYGNPESHIRRMVYSLFLQDDWRIRPRLTLNLGMRYELSSIIHDRNHILGTFDPDKGLVQEGIQISHVYNPDHNNFAPRFGFAWDVRGNGKTVIRAGGSLIYELVILRTFAEVGNSPGLAGNQTAWVIGCSTAVVPLAPDAMTNCPGSLVTSGGTRDVGQVSWSRSDGTLGAIQWDGATSRSVYPASAIHNCSPTVLVRDTPASAGRAGSRCPIVSVDPHLSTPYVETWTLSIQHALASNLVLDVAYVGNHGVKLLGRHEDNQPFAGQVWNTVTTGGLTFAQICNNTPTAANACNGQSGAFGTAVIDAKRYINQFPYINTILRLANGMTSNYDGLQVSLTARNFHGFSTILGYTYSKALDVNSSNGGTVGTDSYNLALDYGRAASDLRHRFTFSPTLSLPSVHGYAGLLDGWKLNGIFKYQTGRPWQAGTQWGDTGGVGRSSRPDFFGDPHDFVVDYTGRNFAVFHPGGTTASGINPQTQAAYTSADLAINTPLCATHARSLSSLTANGCWTQGGSAITPAPVGVFGTMTRGLFDGPSYWDLDTSVSKRQTINEKFSAEFRGEFFNVFNHPIFAQPATGVTCSATTCNLGLTSTTPDVAATNPVLGSGGARRVQLGVKVIF
jgi:Carboxypeptidase regulatory-like domain/TonB dependent receptor